MKNITFLAIICLIATVSYSQWTEQTTFPQSPKLNCVSVGIGGTEGWVGCDSGAVLYTSNSGTNWYYRNNTVIGNKCIHVISSMPGPFFFNFVTGKALCSAVLSDTTYIYRTADSGNNWAIVYQKPGCIRAIIMIDTLNGFVLGDPVGGRWTILKTTNGGINFDSLYSPPQQIGSELGNYGSFVFGRIPFDSLLMFGTNSGRIYRTTNGGHNWDTISMTFQNILTVQLGTLYESTQLNPIGYAAGSGAAVTTNYGATWTPLSLPGSGNITSFHTELGWGGIACYSRGSVIYSSTNYTTPFTVQYTSPNGGNYAQISLSVFQFEGGFRGGWGVKDNGTLSRYYVLWGGIQKISSLTPKEFSLSQNFPNPFNPKTTIKYDIAKLGDVKLIIYDILGREITTLVNEPLQPGTYETEWDASNYPSGVYFYKLINPDYTETKKMVLIK
jgi:photosystem II stability/assembly factor-like uncharacterized protein